MFIRETIVQTVVTEQLRLGQAYGRVGNWYSTELADTIHHVQYPHQTQTNPTVERAALTVINI